MKQFILFILFIFLSNNLFAQSNLSLCKECNVIIISLTGLRKQNMGNYGYKRNTTPQIDRFFSNALRFTNSYSPASLTYTDSISLFYSLSPQIHQNFGRFQKEKLTNILSKYSSLPEILTKNGYNTAAFVGDEDYSFDRGIGRTFQYYFDRSFYADHDILFKPFTYSIGTKQLIPIANKWLEKNHKKKFMLFLQGFDMHCPYSPTGEFAKLYEQPHSSTIPFTTECFMTQKDVEKNSAGHIKLKSFFAYLEKKDPEYYFSKQDQEYLISRYDAELNQTDSNLKVLFDKIKELNLDKNTIIILMSDHGDNLGENGYFMKMSPTAQGNLHRANLGFPLLIKLPALKKLHIQNQIIQSIDMAPTLLELLGLKAPKSMQGKSFMNIIGKDTEINDYAYGYSIRFDQKKVGTFFESAFHLETIIGHEWKLDYSREINLKKSKPIEDKYLLYNLKNDPSESNNLINKVDYKKKADDLKQILRKKREKYKR